MQDINYWTLKAGVDTEFMETLCFLINFCEPKISLK